MTPLWAVALLAATPLRLGVVPSHGDGPAERRLALNQAVLKAAAALPDLQVVALSELDAIEGPGASARLMACRGTLDCIRRAVAAIQTDKLLVPSLDESGGLTLVLAATTTVSAPAAKEILVELTGTAEDRDRVVRRAVYRLFPERFKQAMGTVRVTQLPDDAEVRIDGEKTEQQVVQGQLQLELPPGSHELRVQASGRRPYQQKFDLEVGSQQEFIAQLKKNRSNGPYILGGGALVLAGVAGVVGLSVSGQASDWGNACPVGEPCGAGFTRERYLQAQDEVSRGRSATNVMFGTAAAALIGGIVWYIIDPGSDGDDS